MDWKERAQAAYAAEQAAIERAKHAQELAQALKLAVELNRVLDIATAPTGETIDIDGVTFGYDGHLYLLGTCPYCGQPARSVPLKTLADVGRQLSAFEPGEQQHRLGECKSK